MLKSNDINQFEYDSLFVM